MHLQKQKLCAAKIGCVLCLAVCLPLFAACSAQRQTDASQQAQVPSATLQPQTDAGLQEQATSVTLQPYTGAYLYADIPAPDGADVFTMNTNMNPSEDDTYVYHAFTLENFTQEEADRYIALLEATVVEKRESYTVYTESAYPILNYFGWLPDGSAVSLSQSNTGGGILINVKK